MTNPESILGDLLGRLRARFGARITIEHSAADEFVVRLATNDEALVSVALADPDRPSFCVSYTELRRDRRGKREFVDVTRDGVLEAGLVWIARKVAKHGYVPGVRG